MHLYQAILNRTPAPSEVQGWLNQGLSNVDAFKSVARQIFESPEYANRGRTDREFVYDCYEAYLYREPEPGGWDFWTGLVPSQGRDNVRENGFASSQEFADRVASTLVGETLWLTADQLGTPRIINDGSGSLASIKRHDYLPFGEELFAGTGGRTQQQGYNGNADGNRKRWAQLERDDETGLDYFGARYYSSTQGRFTSVDPSRVSVDLINPQSWNRYTYTLNNPLVHVDHNGKWPTKIHNEIIDRVFLGLSKAQRQVIKDASWSIDNPRNGGLDSDKVYRHGLRRHGQSVEDAANQAYMWISNGQQGAQSASNQNEKLRLFGARIIGATHIYRVSPVRLRSRSIPVARSPSLLAVHDLRATMSVLEFARRS